VAIGLARGLRPVWRALLPAPLSLLLRAIKKSGDIHPKK
jgi:hypothetical protein